MTDTQRAPAWKRVQEGMLMFKKPMYGSKISPACAYCAHGSPAADNRMVLCKQRGVVSPYYCCKKFVYDPLIFPPHLGHSAPVSLTIFFTFLHSG